MPTYSALGSATGGGAGRGREGWKGGAGFTREICHGTFDAVSLERRGSESGGESHGEGKGDVCEVSQTQHGLMLFPWTKGEGGMEKRTMNGKEKGSPCHFTILKLGNTGQKYFLFNHAPEVEYS